MRWSRATDAELLAASGSDPEAFGELYDRFETAVVGGLAALRKSLEETR